MSGHTYEVEIKSLLGSKERAEKLKQALRQADPQTRLVSSNKQLNHYFIGGDRNKLIEKVRPLLTPGDAIRFEELVRKAKDFSLRTRLADSKLLLVCKISMNDETSSNGVKRLEFEAEIPNCTLDKLDQQLLAAGFSYQAKWSREREEYQHKGATVTIDKNAGYGYVAEFELMEEEEKSLDQAKHKLLALMAEVGAEELDQARLERMFKHYNEHWAEYYGTDKVFEIL